MSTSQIKKNDVDSVLGSHQVSLFHIFSELAVIPPFR